jgi:hypothetical protein
MRSFIIHILHLPLLEELNPDRLNRQNVLVVGESRNLHEISIGKPRVKGPLGRSKLHIAG